jgi:hypothetical protein
MLNQYMFVLVIAGAVVVVLLAGIIRGVRREQEYLAYLYRHGRRIVAYVVEIQHWTSSSYRPSRDRRDSDDRYRVVAVATDPQFGRSYSYESSVRVAKPPVERGDPVILLIDPRNPSDYHMDI